MKRLFMAALAIAVLSAPSPAQVTDGESQDRGGDRVGGREGRRDRGEASQHDGVQGFPDVSFRELTPPAGSRTGSVGDCSFGHSSDSRNWAEVTRARVPIGAGMWERAYPGCTLETGWPPTIRRMAVTAKWWEDCFQPRYRA